MYTQKSYENRWFLEKDIQSHISFIENESLMNQIAHHIYDQK